MNPQEIQKLQKAFNEIGDLNLKYGFIKNVNINESPKDEPDFYNVFGEVFTKNSKIEKDKKYQNSAGGLDKNKDFAFFIMFAEALERYANSRYDIKDFKFESFNNLEKEKQINIDLVNNRKKFDIKTFKDTKIHWDICQSYFDKKDYYVPAQLIYVPFQHDSMYLRHSITTGVALHSSKDEAIYSAISENIERDNFITTYLNKITPTRIPYQLINDEQIKSLIKEFTKCKLKINLFKINPQTEFSTILTVIEDETQKKNVPAITVGASCDVNIITAIKKSIKEAYKTRFYVLHKIITFPEKFKKTIQPQDVQDLKDRALFWAQKENKHHLNFILKTTKIYNKAIYPISDLSPKKSLQIFINYLQQEEYDLYIKDLRLPECKTIYIYRAIIPQLHPLYLFESYKCDKGLRLKGKINKIPHPFL